MEKTYTRKEIFKESIWITIAWEWLQSLLGRAVDPVLWTTMIIAGYQLIPGAPALYPSVSIGVFIAQFVALDIGGMGLNQIAREQGLPPKSYARIIAYCLIGITLITITYSGIEHAISNLDSQFTSVMEVILVVARSIMTILYGTAIHSLKVSTNIAANKQEELEAEVASLQEQLVQERKQIQDLQEQLGTRQDENSSLRMQLNTAQVDIATMQTQLDGREQELAEIRKSLANGEERQEARVQQILDGEQQRIASIQQQLANEQSLVVTLRQELQSTKLLMVNLNADQQQVLSLQEQLASEQARTSNLYQELQTAKLQMVDLNADQKQMANLRQQLEVEQTTMTTLRGQLNTALLNADEQTRTMTHLQNRLTNAEEQVQNLTAKLEQKNQELAEVFASLQTAKGTIADLQNVKSQTVQPAKNRTAKSGTPTASSDNITSIETAKSSRISHAEVLAYMTANPDLKRAEVAAHLSISERKVYDAIAWGKEQEPAI